MTRHWRYAIHGRGHSEWCTRIRPGAGGRSGRAVNEAAALEIIPLGLTHRIYADGCAVVAIRGELDAATADQAYDYARQIIDRATGPVSVDLAGLSFCDARGLRALVRIAAHARDTGRPVSLTSARPPILKIMRITGVDAMFPELPRPGQRPGTAGTGHSRAG